MGLFREFILYPEKLTTYIGRPFQSFVRKEISSGILLMAAAAMAMLWANSPLAHSYHAFWHTKISVNIGTYGITKSLAHWIDEGLMVLFFFTVGLEIKREMLVGELATFRKAVLPASAALGGMLVPALIYFLLNRGGEAAVGWGIPMATDIAFALGVAAMLGRGLPPSLRVFLSAFAIADDLGAVFVIALFYQKGIVVSYLYLSLAIIVALWFANFLKIRNIAVYVVLGIGLWITCLGSGVHATVAGVVVALFIPARGEVDTDRFMAEAGSIMKEFSCPPEGCGRDILTNMRHLNALQAMEKACERLETPLQRLEHGLHPWVAILVIPLFALANGGVTLSELDIPRALTDSLTLGIVAGLVVGKPLGITFFSFFSVRLGFASLPYGVNWRHILGAGMLGGMGFTMSLFIGGLSFPVSEAQDFAKVGIMLGSVCAGTIGFLYLKKVSSGNVSEGDM